MERSKRLSSYLPEDILRQIFILLPIQSILVCKSVSKLWMEVVSKQWNELIVIDPKYFKLYNARRSRSEIIFMYKGDLHKLVIMPENKISSTVKGQLHPPFIVHRLPILVRKILSENVGYHKLLSSSSSGLAACILSNDGFFLLYNFLNGASYTVTSFPREKYFVYCWLCYGFSYDRDSDDFKIMVVCKDNSSFWVYSFGNCVWEKLVGFPYTEYILHQPQASAFNGVLHWVATVVENPNKQVIFTYELSTRRFGTMLLPQHVYDYGLPYSPKRVPRVGELDGQLCCWMFSGDPNKFELWVMRDYGVPESWTRLMSLSGETGASQFSYSTTPMMIYDCENGGKGVLLASSRNRVLHCYDTGNGKIDTVHWEAFFESKIEDE